MNRQLKLVEAGLKEARATFSQKYVAQALGLRGRILVECKQAAAGGRDLKAAVALAESLHSPTLFYPLAYALGAWCSGVGEEGQAAIYYQKAKAAVDQMTVAMADEALRAKLLQSAPVRAIGEAVR